MAISTEEMRARQEAAQGDDTKIGQAIQEITERAQILIHEEIELAKAEMSVKLKSLARGAAIGGAAGVFILAGLIYFLHFVALALADLLGANPWVGYLIVSGTLFILAGIGGFVAARLFKKGSPPMPQMAIEEAQRIKQTIQHAEGSAR